MKRFLEEVDKFFNAIAKDPKALSGFLFLIVACGIVLLLVSSVDSCTQNNRISEIEKRLQIKP